MYQVFTKKVFESTVENHTHVDSLWNVVLEHVSLCILTVYETVITNAFLKVMPKVFI